MRHIKTTLLAGATVLALALLAACGGDDDKPDTTTASATSASTRTATAVANTGGNTASATPEEEETATPASTDDGGSSEELDACALITTDELSDATGLDVADGERIDADPLHNCTWLGEGYSATLDTIVAVDEAQANDYFEGTGGDTEQEIDGLGERAKWTVDTELIVKQGTLLLALVVSSVEFEESALGPTTDLMEKALSRLP